LGEKRFHRQNKSQLSLRGSLLAVSPKKDLRGRKVKKGGGDFFPEANSGSCTKSWGVKKGFGNSKRRDPGGKNSHGFFPGGRHYLHRLKEEGGRAGEREEESRGKRGRMVSVPKGPARRIPCPLKKGASREVRGDLLSKKNDTRSSLGKGPGGGKGNK